MALFKRSFPWRWRRSRQIEANATDQAAKEAPLIEAGQRLRQHREPVSYTHLTLPTKA